MQDGLCLSSQLRERQTRQGFQPATSTGIQKADGMVVWG